MLGNARLRRSLGLAALALSATATPVCGQESESGETIERLLTGGWQIAGFTNTLDNRSALILFRHPDKHYLVQCRSGYDVMRKPPVYVNCYELR